MLLKGAASTDNSEELTKVSELYHELDTSLLKLQLSNLATHFQDSSITLSLEERLKYLSLAAKQFLVIPATNAVSERSFSVMQRIKTYVPQKHYASITA